MRNDDIKIKNRIKVSVILLFLSSASILTIPFIYSSHGESTAVLYFVGAVFWLCLISGYAVFAHTLSLVKKQRKKEKEPASSKKLFKIFKNKYAVMIAFLFLISVIVFCISIFIGSENEIFGTLSIFCLIFLLHMLFITNGKSFTYYYEKAGVNIKEEDKA